MFARVRRTLMAHGTRIRRFLASAPVALVLCIASTTIPAAEPTFPGQTWEMPGASPPEGWSAEHLQIAENRVETTRPTGVIVVQDGRVVAAWGEVARTVNVRSIRKSVLSALLGIGVAESRIDVNEARRNHGLSLLRALAPDRGCEPKGIATPADR